MGPHTKPYLEVIMTTVKSGIGGKKKSEFIVEAVQCLGPLSSAVGSSLRTYIQELLPEFFGGGLTEEVTGTLKILGNFIPVVKTDIQEILLNQIASILGLKKKFLLFFWKKNFFF
jgi:hypothetical protein